MARKSPTPSWLQVFQKPKFEEADRASPSNPSQSDSLEADLDTIREDIAPPKQPKKPRAARRLANLQKAAGRQIAAGAQGTLRTISPIAVACKWQLIWLGILATAGGTAIAAFIWLSKVPPAVDCKQISSWSAESERLSCAQQSAGSGKPEQILEAIKLVKDWTSEHPLYGQAQALMQEWSNTLLVLARDRVAQKDLKGGIALANQIPASSAVYKDAQSAVKRWREEFNKGQTLYDKILIALKKQNWDLASEHMAALSLINDPSWQDRLSEIRQRTTDEKVAWQYLKDARSFVKSTSPDQWGRAIAITDPINRATFVWAQAKNDVLQWRNAVFGLAIVRLGKQDLVGASSLASSIPASVKLTSDNQDLIRLIRAKEVDADTDYRQPALERLAPLWLAIQLLRQINSQSPFYAQAKALLPRLDLEAQGLVQLNLASTLSNVQQRSTLQLAIAQAQQIPLKHPRRLHAQTLLAQWRKEAEWMEDRPVLRQAQQLAKTGKIDPLRSAVALASLVKPQRALSQEAQSSIVDWTVQIQTIEDKPILDEAKAVATSGRLGQAIQVAARVQSGRALYGEAQSLMGEWVYQIQLVEDRPILNQAAGLASGGYLTRAIDVASQISPRRALYREAQGAISRWAGERATILRAREREAASRRDAAPEPSSEPSSAESPAEPNPPQ